MRATLALLAAPLAAAMAASLSPACVGTSRAAAGEGGAFHAFSAGWMPARGAAKAAFSFVAAAL
ncbi:hypothetical protein ACP4OV_028399 [Aristida adscensionis]